MKKFFFTLFIFFLSFVSVYAQEGMWLPNQLDNLDLKNKGLQIEVSDIYSTDKPSLSDAVILLGGGTASFVSRDGLILTNHHVAYTALQRASNTESNYLSKGFLARNRSDEIQAPGYQARLLTEMKDITSEILGEVKNIKDPLERNDKIDKKITEITAEVMKDKNDIIATVSEMYEGNQYILFVYKIFKDIRIVYSPPLSIGKFGGEIDNWMWPRHTGDFSFLRVYVSPDGKGNEYSSENIPYNPKIWLKVAKGNLQEGDLTFMLGYPGFTTRYRSSNSVDWNLNVNYPFSINNYKEIINLLDEVSKNDAGGKLKVANLKTGLANVLKNYEGKVAGMKKTNFLNKKINFEKGFMSWTNSDPARKEKYGDLLTREKEQYDILQKTKDRDNVFGIFQGLAGTQLNMAGQIYSIAKELAKPENERRSGYSQRNIQQAIENLQYVYSSYYEPADKALLLRTLKMADELPQNQRIRGLDYIFNDKSKSIEQFVEDAYKSSKLNDIEFAKNLYGKTVSELEALDNPFINMIKSLYLESEEIENAGRIFSSNVTYLRKQYMDALYEWKGSGLYPDANRTLRFSYGQIKGYSPSDAVWYEPFTTLKGVIDKNTGVEPFDVPDGLSELYISKNFGVWKDNELNDVPVAFTHLCDLTGGSSGSPVMNSRGELIGVVFDGNYEAMISDWQFDYELQRAISVDIRYVLFITEKFGNAGFILDEMGVEH